MMRAQLFAVLVGACPLAALAVPAQCDFHPPHPQEFRKSSMVVMGQVTAVAKRADNTYTDYTVQVDRQLKGKAPKSLVITSENGPKGFPMKEQRTYLLFVSQRPDKTLFIDNCGNSAPMSRKENVLPH
jgi:hypothetical protein